MCTSSACENKKERHRVELNQRSGALINDVRRRSTLPQGPPCSTIDAERLSFRVRNGTGRFPLAMAAETLSSWQNILQTCLHVLQVYFM